jgi:hypothetical protein
MWAMWNLVSVHLDIVLVSVQDRCMVCVKHTIGSEIILDAPNGTPRWRVSSGCSFYSVWNGANLDVRYVHALRQMCHRLINHFGHTRCNSKTTWVMWNLVSVCSETVLVSVQHRCMVCAKRTIGIEIVLDAPNDTSRWRGLSGCSVQSVWR